jgi:hypothetical protein
MMNGGVINSVENDSNAWRFGEVQTSKMVVALYARRCFVPGSAWVRHELDQLTTLNGVATLCSEDVVIRWCSCRSLSDLREQVDGT